MGSRSRVLVVLAIFVFNLFGLGFFVYFRKTIELSGDLRAVQRREARYQQKIADIEVEKRLIQRRSDTYFKLIKGLTAKGGQDAAAAQAGSFSGSGNSIPLFADIPSDLLVPGEELKMDDMENGPKLLRRRPSSQSQGASKAQTNSNTQDHDVVDLPVLVMACNRANYLRKTIQNIRRHLPKKGYSIVVSQDGTDASVFQLMKSDEFKDIKFFQHSDVNPTANSYNRIAQHYGWALKKVFSTYSSAPYVIILEDDMDVSSDIFGFFEASARLIASDPSIWLASAWNDNGFAENVKDADVMYRTEVFPGLGWMLTRGAWDEIADKWPTQYWDEWMRLPEIRKGRSMIRPEVCRTKTFGEEGTSQGQFFSKYLARIKLNTERIDWLNMDLEYVKESNFKPMLFKKVKEAKQVSLADVNSYQFQDLRLEYGSIQEYQGMASQLNIMDDEKNQMPRASYHGIVIVRVGQDQSNRLFIVPSMGEWRN